MIRPGPGRLLSAVVLLAGALSACTPGVGEERRATDEAAAPAGVAATGAVPRDDPFAAVTLLDTQGRTIRLGDYRGKVRLIDVWASWCGPCRMIIPHLNTLSDRYRGQGLAVIGVSVDDSPADVVAFTARLPIRYPVGMMNREIASVLGPLDAVPTTYLVDRDGRLRRTFVGFVDPGMMEKEILKYLNAP